MRNISSTAGIWAPGRWKPLWPANAEADFLMHLWVLCRHTSIKMALRLLWKANVTHSASARIFTSITNAFGFFFWMCNRHSHRVLVQKWDLIPNCVRGEKNAMQFLLAHGLQCIPEGPIMLQGWVRCLYWGSIILRRIGEPHFPLFGSNPSLLITWCVQNQVMWRCHCVTQTTEKAVLLPIKLCSVSQQGRLFCQRISGTERYKQFLFFVVSHTRDSKATNPPLSGSRC